MIVCVYGCTSDPGWSFRSLNLEVFVAAVAWFAYSYWEWCVWIRINRLMSLWSSERSDLLTCAALAFAGEGLCHGQQHAWVHAVSGRVCGSQRWLLRCVPPGRRCPVLRPVPAGLSPAVSCPSALCCAKVSGCAQWGGRGGPVCTGICILELLNHGFWHFESIHAESKSSCEIMHTVILFPMKGDLFLIFCVVWSETAK